MTELVAEIWKRFCRTGRVCSARSEMISDGIMKSFQANQFSNNYNVAFASYLMAMAPAILAYLFTQRFVMEGVTQGAVKG